MDKIAWAMKDIPPATAVTVGGRQLPNHDGRIFGHFEINCEWPDGKPINDGTWMSTRPEVLRRAWNDQ